MPNPYFQFKQFTIYHDRCAMKVTTDGCLFGAWVARHLSTSAAEGKLLDIGTGTGLLSLMIAQQNNLAVDAVEIDPGAAAQAAENVAFSPFRDKISIHCHNILQYSPAVPYNVIVSNPPFYEKEISGEQDARNLAHHSTELKLAQLLQYIHDHLIDEGQAYLLLPAKRSEEIRRLLGKAGLHIKEGVTVQQTPRHEPFRLMLCLNRKPVKDPVQETIVIRNEEGQYTVAFSALLSPYYLYLP